MHTHGHRENKKPQFYLSVRCLRCICLSSTGTDRDDRFIYIYLHIMETYKTNMSFRLFLYSSTLCRLKLHWHCKQIHMNLPGSKHGRVLSHKTTVCKHAYAISQSRLSCGTKYYNSCDYLWKQNHSCSDTHYNNTIPNGVLIFYYCFTSNISINIPSQASSFVSCIYNYMFPFTVLLIAPLVACVTPVI